MVVGLHTPSLRSVFCWGGLKCTKFSNLFWGKLSAIYSKSYLFCFPIISKSTSVLKIFFYSLFQDVVNCDPASSEKKNDCQHLAMMLESQLTEPNNNHWLRAIVSAFNWRNGRIFHQPRFPWNKGMGTFQETTFWGEVVWGRYNLTRFMCGQLSDLSYLLQPDSDSYPNLTDDISEKNQVPKMMLQNCSPKKTELWLPRFQILCYVPLLDLFFFFGWDP